MKHVEPQEGSGKTLTTTLLSSKPSYFRQVCHYSWLIRIIGIELHFTITTELSGAWHIEAAGWRAREAKDAAPRDWTRAQLDWTKCYPWKPGAELHSVAGNA